MELKFDYEKTTKENELFVREIITWIVCIVGAILLAFFVTKFGIEKMSLTDSSMDKTLLKNEKIIINKFVYSFTEPKRFDIIVFKQQGKEHVFYNVKRIIGLPKEKIYIEEGIIYVNGKRLEEVSNVSQTINAGLADEEITLGKDEYFVLGDNRINSEDSRYANIGNIKKKDIVGKAWIRLKPFDFISKLNLISNEEK